MKNFNEYFKNILFNYKKINKSIAKFENECYIDEYILTNQFVKEDELLDLYSEIFNIKKYDYIESLGTEIVFSLEKVTKYRFLAFDSLSFISCVIDSPYHLDQIHEQFIEQNKEVRFLLVTKSEFENFLNRYKIKLQDSTYESFEVPCLSVLKEENELEYEEVNAAPLVQIVAYWLNKAILLKASDIHFEPLKKGGVIRVRLDGILKEMEQIKEENYEEVISRLKILGGLDITQKLIPQDGKIPYSVDGLNYDLRISFIPCVLGEKAVIRILDANKFNADFSILNYTLDEEELIKKALKNENGVILVTGPTGSGKSTTLYAYLKQIERKEKNIVTVEDPVEYSIMGINQIQVNPHIDLNFSTLLPRILRQDPDVIMIGEIRDEETAQMAMRAAISGHLVLSTLHTNYAVGAISRLLDMGIPRYLVQSGLRVVVSQKLVRCLCEKCKKKVFLSESALKKYGLSKESEIYTKGGCLNCYYTGYKGRVLLSEILVVDDQVKDMIMESASERKIEAYAVKHGFASLKGKLKKAIQEGIASIEELF